MAAPIVLPGDALDEAQSKSAASSSAGTHFSNAGTLAASLAGSFSSATGSVSHIAAPPFITTNALPTVGAIVLLRVMRLTQRAANGVILTVTPPPVKGKIDATLARPCAEPFSCTLRREDMRATEKDKIKVAESVRPGDIVRAEVIGIGDQQAGYYVSTARNELGVVLARTASGLPLVPASWREMVEPESGARESRKVAKP